ncbi:MAG: hypothetical protein P8X64_06610 [Anaerolineales bacterium]|jgi:hypothetical protein
MNNIDRMNVQILIKVAFWRAATAITGIAIRNQRLFNRALWIAPIVLAAIAAYFLGRVFGNLVLWGLTL